MSHDRLRDTAEQGALESPESVAANYDIRSVGCNGALIYSN